MGVLAQNYHVDSNNESQVYWFYRHLKSHHKFNECKTRGVNADVFITIE